MKEHRLRRIFASDQRAVILACDHAGFMGAVNGLEHPGQLIGAISETGVDAVLTTIGVARRFANQFGRMGLILRVDGGASKRSPVMGDLELIYSIEDAVRLGADAVACMGMIGFPEEPSSLRNLTRLSSEAEIWNMPLLAEMLVHKDGAKTTVEDIKFAMRIGVELGADLIKTSFAPPVEQYQAALDQCYRPVVVLGGSKAKGDEGFLQSISDAMKAGANGVAVGRNIWQHPDPVGMCRALVALVHGGATVSQALMEIKG